MALFTRNSHNSFIIVAINKSILTKETLPFSGALLNVLQFAQKLNIFNVSYVVELTLSVVVHGSVYAQYRKLFFTPGIATNIQRLQIELYFSQNNDNPVGVKNIC